MFWVERVPGQISLGNSAVCLKYPPCRGHVLSYSESLPSFSGNGIPAVGPLLLLPLHMQLWNFYSLGEDSRAPYLLLWNVLVTAGFVAYQGLRMWVQTCWQPWPGLVVESTCSGNNTIKLSFRLLRFGLLCNILFIKLHYEKENTSRPQWNMVWRIKHMRPNFLFLMT